MPAQPTISLVTPTLDGARFLAETLSSVLGQGYPQLEYVVMDGGSTDGSVEIIRSFESQLAHWRSQPDGGLYHALNEGFALTKGEIMGWLNGDDLQMPWTLKVVGEIFGRFPEIDWISSLHPMILDTGGSVVAVHSLPGFSAHAFRRGENLTGGRWPAAGFIQQESTFWRRSLWDAVGGIDTSFQLAGDFDLWRRFFGHAHLVGIGAPLAGFREHADQKSTLFYPQYLEEALESLSREGARPRGALASTLRRAGSFLPGRARLVSRSRARVVNCIHGGRQHDWLIVEGPLPRGR